MLLNIDSARAFFTHVVRADLVDAMERPLEIRAAFHSATSLVSLRDWVLNEHDGTQWFLEGRPQGTLQNTRAGRGRFQRALGAHSDAVRIVTAIANASKHMRIEHPLAGGLASARDVAIREVGGSINDDEINVAELAAGPMAITVLDLRRPLEVHRCLSSALGHWSVCSMKTAGRP